jgi:hypothetical protein
VIGHWSIDGPSPAVDPTDSSDSPILTTQPFLSFKLESQQQAYGTSSYTSSSGQRYGRSFGGGSSSGGRGGRW